MLRFLNRHLFRYFSQKFRFLEIGICLLFPGHHFSTKQFRKYHFTSIFRRQRVNELSACTRVRQNFLDKVSRFWELQGITLKIPRIENEVLCLYTLHRCITKHGGFSKCCQDKKWGQIAVELGYSSKAGAASALRLNYEKHLYPFDVVSRLNF